jgi:competence protein ComEA
MTTIRKWVRVLFGFSGTETNGFLILLPLIFLLLFSEPLYRWATTSDDVYLVSDKVLLDSLVAQWKKNAKPSTEETPARMPSIRLFRFNPNTASVDNFEKLGLEKKLASRMINFRSKGGKFFVKADMLKIYGMDTVLYRRLFPFIDLPEKKEAQKKESTLAVKNEIAKRDINDADTVALKEIYGIGSKLAKRIITYRQKLGGFIHTDQLREVYGLDTAIVKKMNERFFIAGSFEPKRLNINDATDRELSTHPYISPATAKAIVTYRFQHGNYATVEDIRSLQILKKDEADKIIPYISVNP